MFNYTLSIKKIFLNILVLQFLLVSATASYSAEISGELKTWHKVTLTFDGPNTSENNANNPFTNYRLDVTFTHPSSGTTLLIPGYYAADGNAANTSANSGNKWRVHLSPSEIGTWEYSASFRTGTDIHAENSPTAGNSAGFMDGETGSFSVEATDKTGRDMRSKGWLQWVGEHYLRFKGTGEYFLKQGVDSPEVLLGFNDFDNQPNKQDYDEHVADWNPGDPTWQGNKGKGLIGAINYLASEGLNSISFIPMSVEGDAGGNIFPYVEKYTFDRIDVSKVDQWGIVFDHATAMGMFLHFKTQETENETLLDGGDTGRERKLYYRELIARFSYHPALNWNIGEEIGEFDFIATLEQRKAMAEYFWAHDPYNHHVVAHNGAKPDDYYNAGTVLTGFSLQEQSSDFSGVPEKIKEMVERSAAAGRPWAVSADETGGPSSGVNPDRNNGNQDDARKNAIWGTLLSGGYGAEWYFGGSYDWGFNDFRQWDNFYDYSRYALEFFEDNNIPFWNMVNDNNLSSNSNDFCFYEAGNKYVVFLKNGGTTNLNLSDQTGTFSVSWFDPRNGGQLQSGSVDVVSGGGNRNLGTAPYSTNEDWVILVQSGEFNNPPNVSIDSPANGTRLVAPAYLTVNISASDSNGQVTLVELYNNGALAGTANSAPYSFDLSNLEIGYYTLEARAYDDEGAADTTAITIRVADQNGNDLPWIENFTLADGSTSGSTPNNWTANRPNGTFEVQNNALVVNGGGSEAVLTTGPIDISGATADISLDLRSQGGLETYQDYVRLFYKVDGGPEILIGERLGVQTPTTISTAGIIGTTLELVIRSYVSFGDEYYFLDNLSVTSQNPQNQAPSVSIISPLGGATYGEPADISLEAEATDADGIITRVEFYNGNQLEGTATIAPYRFNLFGLNAGTYTLVARAYDNEGATTDTSIEVTVDAPNQAPVIVITAPLNGTSFTSGTDVLLEVDASDPDGSIDRVEFEIAGSPLGADNTAPYTFSYTNLPVGDHTLEARAYDNDGGLADTTIVVTIVEDNTNNNQAPSVSITSPANNASFSTPANFTVDVGAFDVDGSIDRVELRTNGGNWLVDTTQPYQFDIANLDTGNVTLEARAYDNEGATDNTLINISVIDGNNNNGVPWLETFALANGATSNSSTTSWTAERANGTFEVQNGALVVNGGGSEAVLTTGAIDISGASVAISLDIESQGGLETDQDYVRLFYKLDSGPEILIDERVGIQTPTKISTSGIIGTTLELVLRTYVSYGDEYYLLDNLSVTSGGLQNQPPSVNITSPSNGYAALAPASVTVDVNAEDLDGTINRVELIINDNDVRVDMTAPYRFDLANLDANNYALEAIAYDNEGASSSTLININITNPVGNPQTVTFTPTNDAYLQNGSLFNTGDLRVENGRRVSYLTFVVEGLQSTPSNAELSLYVGSDSGNGTIRLFEGSQSNWTEDTLSNQNKPTTLSEVSAVNGAFAQGESYTFDVSSLITNNGTYTLILEMDSGGNDVSFASKEGATSPALVVTTP